MSDKYPSISSYIYCLANPVMVVDPDGRDVVLLIAKNGAGGYGHMAAVIQDGEGRFYYMTVGNADPNAGNSQLISSGAQGGMVLEPLEAKTMNEAIEMAKQDQNNSQYTDELKLKTSSEMDQSIYESAVNLKENINSGKLEYNVATNNCGDAVVNVIENGTGQSLGAGIDPRPNKMFESIKANATTIQNGLSIKSGAAKFVVPFSNLDNYRYKEILIPIIE